jgi:hypothetical protein
LLGFLGAICLVDVIGDGEDETRGTSGEVGSEEGVEFS